MNMSKWVKKSVECLSLTLWLLIPWRSHAQSLQAVAVVAEGTTGGTFDLCGDTENSTTGQTAVTATCSGSWSDTTGSGSGSGTVTATYGYVRSAGSASETIVVATGGTQTQTTLGGYFQYIMTFPSLTTGASLRAILTVQGSLTGDPTSVISSNIGMTVNGVTGQSCQVVAPMLVGSCTADASVNPGDFVQIQGTLDIYPTATINPNSTGSTSATMNYDGKQKKNGARFAFVLVDSSGRVINSVPIVTASGATYPTK